MATLTQQEAAAQQEAAQKAKEIQAATDELQLAAGRSLSDARASRARISSLQQARTISEAEVARIRGVLDPLRADVSTQARTYTAEKTAKGKRQASYMPVVLEETSDGFVKRYQGTYTSKSTDDGFRQEVYTKRLERYDAQGRLLKVEEYDTFRDNGRERVFLERQQEYKAGELARDDRNVVNPFGSVLKEVRRDVTTGESVVRDYTRRAASQTPVYEITTADKKRYRVTDTPEGRAFAAKKGINLAAEIERSAAGRYVVTEAATGREFETKTFAVGGRSLALGVREVSPTLAAAALAPTTQSPTITRITRSIKPNSMTLSPEIAAQITPPGETTRTDLADPLRLNVRGPSLLTEAAPPRESFGLFSTPTSASLSDRSEQARATGRRELQLANAAAAFGVGVLSFGRDLVTNPVGTLIVEPVRAVANPQETIATIKADPFGAAGQFAAGAALSYGVTRGVGAVRAQKAAAQIEAQLAKPVKTAGESVVIDDAAVLTRKSGESTFKVLDRDVTVRRSAQDAAGLFGKTEGLVAGGDALALAKNVAPDGARLAAAGSSRGSFEIVRGPKLLARGDVVTQLGSVQTASGELFARISRTTTRIERTGKTTTAGRVDIGVLEPVVNVETVVQPQGTRPGRLNVPEPIRVRESVTAGRSVQLSEKGLSFEDITIAETSRGLVDERVRVARDAAGVQVTSEPVKLEAGRFTTTQTRAQPSPASPVNPLELTPEFAFRQLFGDGNPLIRRAVLADDLAPISAAETLTAAPRPAGPSLSWAETYRRANVAKLFKEFEAGRINAREFGGRLRDLGVTPQASTFGKLTNAELRYEQRVAASKLGTVSDADVAVALREVFANDARAPPLLASPGTLGLQNRETAVTVQKPGRTQQTQNFDLSARPLPEARLSAGARSSLSADLRPRGALAVANSVRALNDAVTSTRNSTTTRLNTDVARELRFNDAVAESRDTRAAQNQQGRLADVQKLSNELRLGNDARLGLNNALRLDVSSLRITANVGIPTPPPIVPQIPKIPTPVFPSVTMNNVAGFDVLVKRGGSFAKLNAEPLSRASALVKGLTVADRSAAATVKLVPSGNAAPASFAETAALPNLLKKFRQKDEDTFIEKNANRINTAGEFSQITLKGIAANAGRRGRK